MSISESKQRNTQDKINSLSSSSSSSTKMARERVIRGRHSYEQIGTKVTYSTLLGV
jgi:hypothetical protein